jgi:hypothetical protein
MSVVQRDVASVCSLLAPGNVGGRGPAHDGVIGVSL